MCLIHYINIPPNPTSTNTLSITDAGANIHLTRQATPKMASVTINHEMKARLSDGSTMDSTHISTLQLPGLIRLARQIQIFPKYRHPH